MSDPLAIATPLPAHGWTPERKVRFLDQLAVHGNARAACRAVGLSADAAYKLRRREPLFARAWAAAVVLGRENCCQVLGERAVEGLEEEIYHRGEVVGTRRRYDSRLLLAHLARLDRLADEHAASEDAGRFDELLACIGEGSGTEPLPDRATCIEQAAEAVEAYRRQQLKPYDHAVSVATGVNGELLAATQRRALAVVELDRECAARTAQARTDAAEAWDRRKASAAATVDALCTRPEQPTPRTVASSGDPASAPATRCVRAPWTMSSVSAATVARSLAGPLSGQAATPRSPFSAPRNPV